MIGEQTRGICVTVNAPLRLLGIGHRPAPTDKDSTRRQDKVRRFVPHHVVHSHADHHIDSGNVADLINLERRFYLRPVDANARASQATLMDAFDDDASKDSDLAFFNDFNDTASAKESSVLDLGTVTLQRIVTQMKGLHFEDAPVQDSFVKDAAKLSGLKRYGDYILGVGVEDTQLSFA